MRGMTPTHAADPLADRLHRLRLQAGLSAFALAKAAGTSPQNIYQIEKGITVPRIPMLRRLAAALGVPVRDLF